MNVTATTTAAEFAAPTPARPKDLTTPQGSKEVFLQLLVAQLKNQNPLDPADGVEFIAQLTQFSQLEQMLSMRQDIGAIKDFLTRDATADNGG